MGRTVLSCCRISLCVCELSTGEVCSGDERLGTQQVDEQKLWEGLCYLVVEYLFVCVNCQQVKCVVETRDWEHSKLLEQKLREKYTQVSWGPLHDGNLDVE